jgi:hypothetical protein
MSKAGAEQIPKLMVYKFGMITHRLCPAADRQSSHVTVAMQ